MKKDKDLNNLILILDDEIFSNLSLIWFNICIIYN